MFSIKKKIEKWELVGSTFDSVDIDSFQNFQCGTMFSYFLMFILVGLAWVMLALDIYTCLQILVFHKWSTGDSSYQVYQYSTAKWIFAGCIIFEIVLLVYHSFWAIMAYRTRNIALTYVNTIARRGYSVRYNYHCIYNKIQQDSFFDWAAFYCYFELDNFAQLIIADAPRQYINVMTLRNYATNQLTSNNILENIKDIAESNVQLAVILSAMCVSLVIWCFFTLKFLFAMLMIIPVRVKIHNLQYTGFKKYCSTRVNEKVVQLVKKNQKGRPNLNSTFNSGFGLGDSETLPYSYKSVQPPNKIHKLKTSSSFDSISKQSTRVGVVKKADFYENPFSDSREILTEALRDRSDSSSSLTFADPFNGSIKTNKVDSNLRTETRTISDSDANSYRGNTSNFQSNFATSSTLLDSKTSSDNLNGFRPSRNGTNPENSQFIPSSNRQPPPRLASIPGLRKTSTEPNMSRAIIPNNGFNDRGTNNPFGFASTQPSTPTELHHHASDNSFTPTSLQHQASIDNFHYGANTYPVDDIEMSNLTDRSPLVAKDEFDIIEARESIDLFPNHIPIHTVDYPIDEESRLEEYDHYEHPIHSIIEPEEFNGYNHDMYSQPFHNNGIPPLDNHLPRRKAPPSDLPPRFDSFESSSGHRY